MRSFTHLHAPSPSTRQLGNFSFKQMGFDSKKPWLIDGELLQWEGYFFKPYYENEDQYKRVFKLLKKEGIFSMKSNPQITMKLNDFYLQEIMFTCREWFLLAWNVNDCSSNYFYGSYNDFYLPDNDLYGSHNDFHLPNNDFYGSGNDVYLPRYDFYVSGNNFYLPGLVFTGSGTIFTRHKRCLPGRGLCLLYRNVVLLVKEHFSLPGTVFISFETIYSFPGMISLCVKALILIVYHDYDVEQKKMIKNNGGLSCTHKK